MGGRTKGETGFGLRLRELRAAAGMSQRELADAAGLALGAVTKIEQGDRDNPAWDTVMKLADALKVPTDAFRAPKKGKK